MKKRIIAIVIIAAAAVLCASCRATSRHANDPIPGQDLSGTELPSDFAFSIVWNCYGISSYDSRTGKLVKTTDASDVRKYTSYVKMSDNELKLVYKYLCKDIDLKNYPAEYDPFNAPDAVQRKTSMPDQTIVVAVTAGGETRSVKCEKIMFGTMDDCYCPEARSFMQAVKDTVALITSFPEWEAFPEYEVFYD